MHCLGTYPWILSLETQCVCRSEDIENSTQRRRTPYQDVVLFLPLDVESSFLLDSVYCRSGIWAWFHAWWPFSNILSFRCWLLRSGWWGSRLFILFFWCELWYPRWQTLPVRIPYDCTALTATPEIQWWFGFRDLQTFESVQGICRAAAWET